MASSPENLSMAVFCDFENVALGVRDANYEKFDIKPILERLLLKGSIVVKKAYCDWDRYKSFKATMHEANFELIEIPHVRQSGKNSADIRLVVDALDLCYTKSHVNTFVIISGDSDFSPLVSKLRENAKQVIGVGVKQSTSDLLVANCDEFIFYDDLVRESRRTAAKRDSRDARDSSAPKRTPDEEIRRKEKYELRMTQAIDMAVETFDALVSERADSGKIWASMLKEAIKRRKPDFSESYYGFRTFGNLLEEAQARGLLEFGRDEKSGAYVYRSSGALPRIDTVVEHADALAPALDAAAPIQADAPEQGAKRESRRNGRGGRKSSERGEKSGHRGQGTPYASDAAQEQPAFDQASDTEDTLDSMDLADTLSDAANNGNLIAAAGAGNPGNTNNASGEKRESRRNGRGGRKQSGSGRGEKSASNGPRGQNAPYAYGAPERPAGRLPVFDVEDDEPEQPAGRLPVFDAEDDEPERPAGRLPVFDTDDEIEAAPGEELVEEVVEAKREPRRNSRGGRKSGAGRGEKSSANANRNVVAEPVAELAPVLEVVAQAEAAPEQAGEAPNAPKARAKARSPRKPAAKKAIPVAAEAAPEVVQEAAQAEADATPAKAARKPAARARRPRKTDAPDAV